MLTELLRRRVPQILGVYLAIGWGGLEFTDWLVNRYVLSPYFTDVVLVAWLAMTPAIVMLAWFHGAPGRDKWTAVEKIGIPINIALAALLLFVAFGDKELGAATTSVTIENEAGETEERVIPKSEFRKHLAVYYFENESGDTALDWLQYGLAWALQYDLLQDVFVESRTDFTSRFEQAGIDDGLGVPLALKREIADDVHMEHFLTGSVSGSVEEPIVTTQLYDTRRARVLEERTYSGGGVLELVDSISLQLKRDMKVPTQHIEQALDLPAEEILTNSMPAFRAYVEGHHAMEVGGDWPAAERRLNEAVTEDPSFARAHVLLYLSRLFLNDMPGATESLLAAIELSYKLPERVRFGLRSNYQQLVKQDPEKAIAVAGMYAELYPDDITAHVLLAVLYQSGGEWERAITQFETILEIDPGQYDYLRAVGALYERTGQFAEAADYYQRYADQFPEDARSFTPLGGLSRQQGDHQAARQYYERALLLDPEDVGVMIDLAESSFDLGRMDDAVAQLEEALTVGQTAGERADVFDALRQYYERRGQLNSAVDYMHQAWAEQAIDLPPVFAISLKLDNLGLYAKAGMAGAALDTISAIESRMTAPLDLLPAIGTAQVAVELEDPEMIDAAIVGLERLITGLGAEALRTLVVYAGGRAFELRGACDQAIISYRRALELSPTEVDFSTDIGRCHREIGQFDQALESLERTLKIRPYDATAHHEKALVYIERGDLTRARTHLQTALDVWRDADPDFEPAREARGQLTALESRS